MPSTKASMRRRRLNKQSVASTKVQKSRRRLDDATDAPEATANDINACEKLCSDQASTCHSFQFKYDDTDEGTGGAGSCKLLTKEEFDATKSE